MACVTHHACDCLQKELEELRWFRDRVNKLVLPGESDTHDAARTFINESMRRYRKMEAALERVKHQTQRGPCLTDGAIQQVRECCASQATNPGGDNGQG